MVVPHDIDTQSIESHCLDHFYPVFPVLDGYPGIMNFAGINPPAHSSMVGCIDVGFEWLLLFCGCNVSYDADNNNHKNRLLMVLLR